jgi:hypothetical protein
MFVWSSSNDAPLVRGRQAFVTKLSEEGRVLTNRGFTVE